ncbi:hypothetical protein SPBR_01370 [Sporothrix brasiliensis 5110]|uniref:Tafazzin n=1 Tax=Sporothrix brasiliensis 5110 TaxID=1398154 RepID=A0A0C2J405_9PEZI|nr:uncharacterized protein SPBR_01370 [Sporothrix brasiliensis 5110]KIH91812.1 hypothetical protein SPBR_01370 [Sporothrix brasiliensis 5110]
MPKKRHWGMYSKPQSTAPHSLESSGLQSNVHHEEPQSRNVNDLLANLRRTTLSPSGGGSSNNSGSGGHGSTAGASLSSSIPVVTPSVPPEVAQILLPSPPNGGRGGLDAGITVGPSPRGAAGGPNGLGAVGGGGGRGRRRGPAGPAPPPSWLAQSRHNPRRILRPSDRNGHSASDGGGNGNNRPVGAQRRRYASGMAFGHHAGEAMPGIPHPVRGSLVDVVLHRIVLEWTAQKQYNRHQLIYLQGPLRAALVSYLGQLSEEGNGKGATIKDLRALLLHPTPPSSTSANGSSGSPQPGGYAAGDSDPGGSDSDGDNEEMPPLPSPSTLNEDFRHLDLTWSIGNSISVREVNELLFPSRSTATHGRLRDAGHKQQQDDAELLESWDAPGIVSLPRPLLPNLTHLSLALMPDRTPQSVSWRQLLSFAAHLPMLTHLSLAYWPEPTLTPNAKLATVDSPLGRRFQYGATGAYSHSIDNDWAEAVLLLRKLSKALYGLEYLDLTGCASWLPALMYKVDNGQVDWVGNWGKLTTLVLDYGVSNEYDRLSEAILEAHRPPTPPEPEAPGAPAAMLQRLVAPQQPQLPLGELARRVNAASEARLIEEKIRTQRAGRGRFITVVYDRQPEATR